MKKILLGVLLATTSTLATAQIDFSNYNSDAHTLAENVDQLILIEFTASWCPPCQRMKSNVFTDKEVGDYYNNNFVCTQIDVDNDEDGISDKYNVSSIPAFVFINSDGDVVHKFSGYYEKEEFLERGEKALHIHDEGASKYDELLTCIEENQDIYCDGLGSFMSSNEWKTPKGAELLTLYAMYGNESVLEHYQNNKSTYSELLSTQAQDEFNAYLAVIETAPLFEDAIENGKTPNWKTVENSFKEHIGTNYLAYFLYLKADYHAGFNEWEKYVESYEGSVKEFAKHKQGDDKVDYLLDEMINLFEEAEEQVGDIDEVVSLAAYDLLIIAENSMVNIDKNVYFFLYEICGYLGKTEEMTHYEALYQKYAE